MVYGDAVDYHAEVRSERGRLKAGIGPESHQTAWTRLHKIRRAMVRPGRERLSGVIEADETYPGGSERG
jgi:hypothetical protein